MAEFEPKQFGKYFLLEKLAVGGMAEIYKAKTFGVDGFEKELAIKRILPHCSADKDFITMLIDEAKLSVMLSHANIVQVYDLGKVSDDYFISMEFIHGPNLRDIMFRCREKKIAIPTDISVYIVSEMCKGLDYAHRKTDQNNHPLNIVHRDISPQNVLISYEGEVKIVDFGIAKAAMNISHTMAGILKGKIAYMSPEQAMGKSIDRRTDIFSTGILLYEMLTGTKLFTGESQFEVLKKIRTAHVKEELLPDSIPKQLKPIVAKALAYNVDDRYQQAGDMQIDLTKYLYSTHNDFSPRKLSSFVDEIFSEEREKEQVERAREFVVEQQTSSLSFEEGAEQQEIVHRDATAPKLEETRQYKIPSSGTPGMTLRSKEKTAKAPVIKETPTESKTFKKSKKIPIIALAAGLSLAIIGFASYYLISKISFTKKPTEIAISNTEGIPGTGTLKIESDPPGARISINGTATDKTTPTIVDQLEIGATYTVKLEKENLSPAEQTVRIDSGTPIDISLKLLEPTGSINVATEPAGASIIIDGQQTGFITPSTLEKLPLGKDLRITISKPEFADVEQVINLTSSKPQKISAKLKAIVPQSGKIVISSTPPGANIILNGADTGRTTPATIANLEPKKYSITLSANGYQDWTGSYDVPEDIAVPVDAQLARIATAEPQKSVVAPVVTTPTQPAPQPTPPPPVETTPAAPTLPTPPKAAEPALPPPTEYKSVLSVTSKPGGADITFDGKPTGLKTPTSIPNLKLGSSHNIKLELEGYKSFAGKKDIKKEKDSFYAALIKTEEKPVLTPQVPAQKTPEPVKPPEPTKTPEPPLPPVVKDKETSSGTGSIKIASNPSGADVFIGGEHKGVTPLTVTVPAGSVSVLVSKEGLSRFSRLLNVKPGDKVSLTDIKLGGEIGSVFIKSDPPRASVTIDGQQVPPTPVTVRKVKRDKSHTVIISLPGYKTWSKTFTMDSDNESINATLQPE